MIQHDQVRETVRQLWQDHFHVDHLPDDANFFELGGRSRELVMVAFAIEEKFAIELSLRDLVNAPTPAAMADLVIEKVAAA
jgi:acyl carrier protein